MGGCPSILHLYSFHFFSLIVGEVNGMKQFVFKGKTWKTTSNVWNSVQMSLGHFFQTWACNVSTLPQVLPQRHEKYTVHAVFIPRCLNSAWAIWPRRSECRAESAWMLVLNSIGGVASKIINLASASRGAPFRLNTSRRRHVLSNTQE